MKDEMELREETIQGLESMARFLRENPFVPMPVCSMNSFARDMSEMISASSAMRRKIDKPHDGSEWYICRTEFGGAVTLDVNLAQSAVCKRVVIGKRIVPAAPEHEEEVYGWECPESVVRTTGDQQ